MKLKLYKLPLPVVKSFPEGTYHRFLMLAHRRGAEAAEVFHFLRPDTEIRG